MYVKMITDSVFDIINFFKRYSLLCKKKIENLNPGMHCTRTHACVGRSALNYRSGVYRQEPFPKNLKRFLPSGIGDFGMFLLLTKNLDFRGSEWNNNWALSHVDNLKKITIECVIRGERFYDLTFFS